MRIFETSNCRSPANSWPPDLSLPQFTMFSPKSVHNSLQSCLNLVFTVCLHSTKFNFLQRFDFKSHIYDISKIYLQFTSKLSYFSFHNMITY